jgi:glycosyltransferase involved in cell wall biosynthesis
MLCWEYPPFSVGGLASHVEDLLSAYSGNDELECHLITLAGNSDLPPIQVKNNVYIHRIKPYDSVTAPDFITWVLQVNVAMLEYANGLTNQIDQVDVIHAHDWLVAFAARALKHSLKLPLIATIHATERGRNNGIHSSMQRYIDNVEWWLCYEAWKVICCSGHMHWEITNNFQVPADKVVIIPNGVDPGKFMKKAKSPVMEKKYAHTDKLVCFIGRLVREKGIQVLIEAAPRILSRYPNTRFAIVGKGPYQHDLMGMANGLGVGHSFDFLGYVEEEAKRYLLQNSTVACFPSLYEPFGIVALEAMICKTPVVVSQVGGFEEIIDHRITGLKAYPGNANSLGDQILAILDNRVDIKTMVEQAYQKVQHEYSWSHIAGKTMGIYLKVKDESENTKWVNAYERLLTPVSLQH